MNGAVLLLDWAVKVAVIVALALGVVTLLRRESAAIRHCVLAVALTCAAALPLLHFVYRPGTTLGARATGSRWSPRVEPVDRWR